MILLAGDNPGYPTTTAQFSASSTWRRDAFHVYPRPDPMALQPGSVFAGEYKIVHLLDEGGMGAVYLAEQLATGRQRALKTMHPHLARDATLRAKFEQEARISAQIPSEHVVEVIGAGVDQTTDMPWLAMELLEGETLAKRLQREGGLPPTDVLTIFDQICHALEAAHERGIVHRDLKPENIFLAYPKRRDISFTVKVLDFGIAKWLHDAQAASVNSMAIGTALWMAPEQATPGAAVSSATDVWPLGLLAFTLFTGRSYWKAANALEGDMRKTLAEVLIAPLERATERATSLGLEASLLPGEFDAWFDRCVVREADARFPDAAMVRAAFELVTAGMLKNVSAASGVPRTVPMSPLHLPLSSSDKLDLAADIPINTASGAKLATIGGLLLAAACAIIYSVSGPDTSVVTAPTSPIMPSESSPPPTTAPSTSAFPIPVASVDPDTIDIQGPVVMPAPELRTTGPVGNAQLGGASVAGGSVANAQSVVAGMAAGFRRCYNKGLLQDPNMKGSVRITAKIGPNGEVLSAVPSGRGLSGTVVGCVAARVSSTQFAPPEGGGATVVIPVTFVSQ
jgi:serine/threonine protein kinase